MSKISTGARSGQSEGGTEAILDHPFWYHRIDLGDGFYTPGYVDAHKYLELDLSEDLSGKTVLDIGAYNGLFSFEAERRGAEYVLATDLWEADDRDVAPEQNHRLQGFRLAHEYLDSTVDTQSIDLLDISPETVGGTFDIVLCPGVIYRLKRLTRGIENLVSVADERVVVTSMYPEQEFAGPAMEFYEDAERMNDPSIWWMPNPDCLEGLLRTAGCTRVETSPIRTSPTDDSTPPVPTAVLGDQPVELYRDHQLTEQIDSRPIRDTGRTPPSEADAESATVPVLYQTDTAARVMYTVETEEGWVERKQAWIDVETIEYRDESSNTLVDAALDTLRSEGPLTLARRSVRYALGNTTPREYLVHGYVE
jgi:tRNA (mo5U34)-methyltransferase